MLNENVAFIEGDVCDLLPVCVYDMLTEALKSPLAYPRGPCNSLRIPHGGGGSKDGE